jgi:hypothetical protein
VACRVWKDSRTGEVLKWLFDKRGNVIPAPPASGVVYDFAGVAHTVVEGR